MRSLEHQGLEPVTTGYLIRLGEMFESLRPLGHGTSRVDSSDGKQLLKWQGRIE